MRFTDFDGLAEDIRCERPGCLEYALWESDQYELFCTKHKEAAEDPGPDPDPSWTEGDLRYHDAL